jgi:hypothetical protein
MGAHGCSPLSGCREQEVENVAGDDNYTLIENQLGERKGTTMHQTIIVAIYSPLAIVGMMLVITWGMNAASSRREGDGQDVIQHIELCEICPMRPLGYGR